MVVVDTGVFLAAVLDNEPYSERAQEWLRYAQTAELKFVAPYLLRYETTSVLRNQVRFGRLSLEAAEKVWTSLSKIPVELVYDEQLVRRAYDLATTFNLATAYDTPYLTVAERYQCEFWTLDERLFNSVGDKLSWVKWIAASPPPT